MVSIVTYKNIPITDARDPDTSIQLHTLWETKPTLFLFLRRLGCALCRSYAKQMDSHRQALEELKIDDKPIRVVAMSFEAFGEGSDSDRSFEAGNFWTGPIYVINKRVYEKLFGRKGLTNSFFGLLDMDKGAVAAAKSAGIEGNLRGDGFQLGGQILVNTQGEVIFQHKQRRYGDDASLYEIQSAIEDRNLRQEPFRYKASS
jgi:AhpC/TSA antioxidant enzyme